VVLDLEGHLCPWILSWAGQGEADGFGFGSGFIISVQTRSIAILSLAHVFSNCLKYFFCWNIFISFFFEFNLNISQIQMF
jgi:hypothetical protein